MWLLLAGIRFYQAVFAPLMPVGCKFYPSCSHYAAEAIARHGAARGVRLAAARLWRCRPFTQGGFDPVPERSRIGRSGNRVRRGARVKVLGESFPTSARDQRRIALALVVMVGWYFLQAAEAPAAAGRSRGSAQPAAKRDGRAPRGRGYAAKSAVAPPARPVRRRLLRVSSQRRKESS